MKKLTVLFTLMALVAVFVQTAEATPATFSNNLFSLEKRMIYAPKQSSFIFETNELKQVAHNRGFKDNLFGMEKRQIYAPTPAVITIQLDAKEAKPNSTGFLNNIFDLNKKQNYSSR
jgi:hypothetical protein